MRCSHFSAVLPAFSGSGFSSGFSSSGFSSSGASSVPVSSSAVSGVQQQVDAAPGSFVTADEFDAQEGASSLPKL